LSEALKFKNYKLYFRENLSRICGLKRDKVTGEWRDLHNEELHDLYSSPNIVLVMKSRIMRWTRHVMRMDSGRGVCRGNWRERDHWGDPGVDGRIILRRTFRN
jgi:hypothetical protein